MRLPHVVGECLRAHAASSSADELTTRFHPEAGFTTVHCPRTHRMWLKHTPEGGVWAGVRQDDMFHSRRAVAGTLVCSHPVRLWDLGRSLTPRETARLQGFPDTFRMPTGGHVRLFGNAVAVPCARHACAHVVEPRDAPLRHVDLCAGIGGFVLALKDLLGEAGVRGVGFSEIYPPAVAWYLANHHPSGDAIDLGDAMTVEAWPQCDVLTAGFPCQPFSRALSCRLGGAHPEDHPKHDFFETVLEAVDGTNAQRVVFENVPTLRTIGKPCYDRLLTGLRARGFATEEAVLDARDFGLPQARKRLYIVGRRDGIAPPPIAPPPALATAPVLEDVLEDSTTVHPPRAAPVGPPFRRPTGRAPNGRTWDRQNGKWVCA